MFAAPEIVVLFFSCVTGKAGFGSCLGRFVLEGNNLRGVALFRVGLAWTVARLASGYFAFPTANLREFCVRGMGEGFELIFVTVFAGVAPDIIFGAVVRWFGLRGLGRLRRTN